MIPPDAETAARILEEMADNWRREGASAVVRACLAGAHALRRQMWQPIESAPKDGSELLLTDGRVVMCGRWLDGAWYEVNNDPSDSWGRPWYDGEAAHWMPLPLPAPPVVREGREPQDPDPNCRDCKGTGECPNAQFRCACRWRKVPAILERQQ